MLPRHLWLADGRIMVVNAGPEAGKRPNILATVIACMKGGRFDMIDGDAVIISGREANCPTLRQPRAEG